MYNRLKGLVHFPCDFEVDDNNCIAFVSFPETDFVILYKAVSRRS